MQPSPYYPPRAGALSRFVSRLHRRRGKIRLRALYTPIGLPANRTVFTEIHWLLVPGAMWKREGRKRLGQGVLAGWLLLLVIQTIALNPLGARIANISCTMLHAISATAVAGVIFPHWSTRARLWRTPLLVIGLIWVVYSIAFRAVIQPIALRATAQGMTAMTHGLNPLSRPNLKTGDWVLYRVNANQTATNFERILARPGDTILFHKNSFEVNGQHFERISPKMPTSGEFVVPTSNYFIWPNGATYTHAGEGETTLLLRLAIVPESDIQGTAYQSWLGKKQPLNELRPIPSPATSP